MLDGDYSEQLTRLLAQFPCQVELPDEWHDYFSAQGPQRGVANDSRRFVRHNFRSHALLEVGPSLPAIRRPPAFFGVYTRDISREGLSFLHTAQLYPGERCQLWLTTRRVSLLVVRCFRTRDRCYVIGGKLC